jgi:hypothetical protein
VRSVLPWLLSPLPAIVAGVLAAHSAGLPLTSFAPNLAAVLLGAALVLGTRTLPFASLARGGLLASVVLLAATLVFPGMDGVHRWLELGPVRLNASAVVLPWLLLGLACERRAVLAFASGVLALGLHLAQPDAGQQTALVAGMLALALADRRGWRLGLAGLGVATLVWTWLRPDPLAPVPQVEEIHLLALRGPATALVAALGLGCLVGGPAWMLWRARSALESRPLVLAIVAASLATLVVPLLGAFPVPVMGAGAGPVLGWLGALAVLRRAAGSPVR